MSRKIVIRYLLSALLSMISFGVDAYNFKVGELCYNITSGDSVMVTYQDDIHQGYSSLYGDLVIPEKVEYMGTTYIVTEIGQYCFKNCKQLNTVSIPGTVKKISGSSFKDCSGLTAINVPSSVIVIGPYSFNGCKSLKRVDISDLGAWCNILFYSNPLEYAHSIYLNGELVEDLIIPDGVKRINSTAFSGCTCIKTLSIPNTVTSINNSAFFGCANLESVTIPNSVITIDDKAFSDCSNMSYLSIGRGVTEIGKDAFSGCTSIATVVWNARLCGGFGSSSRSPFYNKPGIKTVEFGDEVTTIPSYLFASCNGLTSIDIPNSVTTIGAYAFNGCGGLKSATIGKSVKTIGNKAFSYCTQLTSLNWAAENCEDFTDATSSPFSDSSAIQKIVINDGVKSIPAYFMKGKTSLKEMEIPNSISYVGKEAFKDTGWFRSHPVGLIYVGSVAYRYKGTMPVGSNIELREGTKGITAECFSECSGLSRISMPDIVSTIGEYAFRGCTGLTSISIPSEVTQIQTGTFSGCSGLASISIPSNVTEIQAEAFSGCSGLNSISIPNEVTQIQAKTFAGCCGLSSVNIPNSVTEIGDKAFYECKGLTSVVIPEAVVGVGSYAFGDCASLSEVAIGKSLTSISSTAFSGCTSLATVKWGAARCKDFSSASESPFCDLESVSSIEFGAEVERIPAYFCGGCSGLTSVDISATSIGDYAFSNCRGLRKATIGDAVTSIGSYAFQDCEVLTNIESYPDASTITMGSKVFDGVPQIACTLHVKAEYLESYQTTAQWLNFLNIVGDLVDAEANGDLNGDKSIDSVDVSILLEMVLDGGTYLSAADVNNDNSVDSTDVSILLEKVLNDN